MLLQDICDNYIRQWPLIDNKPAQIICQNRAGDVYAVTSNNLIYNQPTGEWLANDPANPIKFKYLLRTDGCARNHDLGFLYIDNWRNESPPSLLDWLQRHHSGLFGDMKDIHKATEYAMSLFPQDHKAACMIALGVYHNSLLSHLSRVYAEEYGLDLPTKTKLQDLL